MENLELMLYLCSVASGLLTFAIISLVISALVAIITIIAYDENVCTLETAIKRWKKSVIVGAISALGIIFTPSKTTCYQILGVSVAKEAVQNSEELQKLPENAIKAVNTLLENITENKKENN